MPVVIFGMQMNHSIAPFTGTFQVITFFNFQLSQAKIWGRWNFFQDSKSSDKDEVGIFFFKRLAVVLRCCQREINS